MGMTHRLKTWPSFFEDVWSGDKPFELRKDDRNFALGDCLILEEWDSPTETYTGRIILAYVGYILRDAPQFGLDSGYAILGLYGIVRRVDTPEQTVEIHKHYRF